MLIKAPMINERDPARSSAARLRGVLEATSHPFSSVKVADRIYFDAKHPGYQKKERTFIG